MFTTKSHTKIVAALALAAAALATPVLASPYVSVGGTHARVDTAGSVTSHNRGTVAVGYEFGDAGKVGPFKTSVELDHTGFGKHGGVYTRATSLSGIAAVGLTDKIDVTGRLGVANVQSGSTSDLTNVVGVGATYKFDKNWAAGVEAKRYGPRITAYTASVKYTF